MGLDRTKTQRVCRIARAYHSVYMPLDNFAVYFPMRQLPEAHHKLEHILENGYGCGDPGADGAKLPPHSGLGERTDRAQGKMTTCDFMGLFLKK